MSESDYKCELGHQQINGTISLCRYCIIARDKQRLQLLEFVKKIPCNNKFIHSCPIGHTTLCEQAEKLLKEINEEK